MQNTLRFVLASYVVFFHIGNYYFPNTGPFAVFGFYTLSGYLITKVLNEVYYKKKHAARDFFTNRFWRLYPPYFAAMALGLLLAVYAPSEASYWNEAVRMPEDGSTHEWLWLIPNVSIVGLHFGLPFSSPIRFSPPSWTTAIEIYFYIFLFFAGAKSDLFAKRWCVASIALIIAMALMREILAGTMPSNWLTTEKLFYSNILGVSMCFALGSWAYHQSITVLKSPNQLIGKLAFLAAVAMPLIPWRYMIGDDLPVMLLHYLESAFVALFLLHAANREFPFQTRHFADLSYPLFLGHWQVAILLSALGLPLVKNDFKAVLAVYVASILFAVIVNLFIENPLKKVRASIRQRD